MYGALLVQRDAQARLELRKHDERIIIYLEDKVWAYPLSRSRWSKRSVLPCIKWVVWGEGMHRTRGVRVRKVGKRYVGVKVERWNPSHRGCPSKERMCLARVHVFRDWDDNNVFVLCTSHMTVPLGWGDAVCEHYWTRTFHFYPNTPLPCLARLAHDEADDGPRSSVTTIAFPCTVTTPRMTCPR